MADEQQQGAVVVTAANIATLYREGRRDFRGADLVRANLSAANLRYADLSAANLSGANLSDADLRGADLRRADLRGANLSGADLSYAYLSYAYLSYANLSGADLSYAYLSYAYLSYANLSGAKNPPHGSHSFVGEVLRQAAGADYERRCIAGLVLMSRDWCWEEFAPFAREGWTAETRAWIESTLGVWPEYLTLLRRYGIAARAVAPNTEEASK